MRKLIKSNPLLLVFLIPVIGDVVGTVAGQPAKYWTSHYQQVNEAAPVYPLLQIHPAVFIVVTLAVWLSFTYFLTKKLRHPLNLWIALALFAGHAYNSIYWLRTTQQNHSILSDSGGQAGAALSLLPTLIYILLIGYIAAWALDRYFSRR